MTRRRSEKYWFAVDLGFFEHPKTSAAGPQAALLYLVSIAWCRRQETDGVIPAHVLGITLAPQAGLSAEEAETAAERLVEAGYWDPIPDEDVTRYSALQRVTCNGWTVHDYADWQVTTASEAERRASTNERVKKHRAGKKSRSGAQSEQENVTRYTGVTDPLHVTPCNARVTPPEKEKEIDREGAKAPSARRSGNGPVARDTKAQSRPRDELFEALLEACYPGVSPGGLTDPARGAMNRARQQIAQVGGTAEMVPLVAKRYAAKYPNAPVTPSALAKHWPAFAVEPTSNGRAPKPVFMDAWKEAQDAAEALLNRERERWMGFPEMTRKLVQAVGAKEIAANNSTARAQMERYWREAQ